MHHPPSPMHHPPCTIPMHHPPCTIRHAPSPMHHPPCTMPQPRPQCFFPEHLLPFLCRPFFVLNPLYDSWQVSFSFAQQHAFPSLDWHHCRTDLRSCPPPPAAAAPRYSAVMSGYHHQMVTKLSPFLPATHSLSPPPHHRRRLTLVEGGGIGVEEGGTEEVGEKNIGDGDGEEEEGGDGESKSGEETGGENERGSEEEKGSEEESESEEKRGGEEEKEENEEAKETEGGARVEGNEEEEEGEQEEKPSADERADLGYHKGLEVGEMGRDFEAMKRDGLGVVEGEAFRSQEGGVSASASRNGALLLSCHLHCMVSGTAWHWHRKHGTGLVLLVLGARQWQKLLVTGILTGK
ncbi:unnamed protein product [Closterium sp. Naga37s-1]|nr:unnamed protein product [Closterium sp. Naga37s-1]